MGTELIYVGGYAHVAETYGLEESIFLHRIMGWYRINRDNGRNYHDGRYWTYNSAAALAKQLPWWSEKQIRRIITSCREQGAIVSGCYNEDKRDRSLWYSPTDELLALYGEGGCSICPNGKTICPEQGNEQDQTGTPLPSNNQEYNTPYSPPQGEGAGETVEPEDKPKDEPKPKTRGKRSSYKPDWFDALWRIYPRKDAKAAAQKKWDALKPDRETCRAILTGLERDKRSEQWQRDGGKYIPMLSTYLNQRRWEDQGVDMAQLPAQPEDRPGIVWADSGGVTWRE